MDKTVKDNQLVGTRLMSYMCKRDNTRVLPLQMSRRPEKSELGSPAPREPKA